MKMTFFECFYCTGDLRVSQHVWCCAQSQHAEKAPRLRKHMREQNKASHADEGLQLLSE
jgi:hypothetical protein